jgi:hypothetical protein
MKLLRLVTGPEFSRQDAAGPEIGEIDHASVRLAVAKWFFALKGARPFAEARESAGDLAWDILMDLYIGELTGRKTSITSACIASGAPPTTGLRYVRALCEEGRIERDRDEKDGRRCWLRLAPAVVEEIDAYLRAAADDLLDIMQAPPKAACAPVAPVVQQG